MEIKRKNSETRRWPKVAAKALGAWLVASSALSCNPWPNQDQETIQLEAPAPEVAYKSTSLTLLSWNVHKGRNILNVPNPEGSIAKLKEQTFDIGCLQEVPYDYAQKVIHSLGSFIGLFTPTYQSAKNGETEGNLLLLSTSLRGVNNVNYHSYQLPERRNNLLINSVSKYLPRSLTIAEFGDMVVFNTHFEARNRQLRDEQAMYAGERLRSFERISQTVIGCADSNSNQRSSVAVNELVPKGGYAISSSLPPQTWQPRIDWLFASPNVVFSDIRAVDQELFSDHLIQTTKIDIDKGA